MEKQKRIFALGFFDGVHLGHQALLSACRELAARTNCDAAVLTFDNHPDTLVQGITPALINTPADRARLLRSYGIDLVFTLVFNRETMTMPWKKFFDLLLWFDAAGIVVGNDFRFGYKSEGDAEKLRGACKEAGIPCTVVPEQTVDGVRVSSTHIRRLLEKGDMETAAKFLGHPHILTGTVVNGQHLGRTLGTPTANLTLPEQLLIPRFGVYACIAHVDGKRFRAVTNVGQRPTVGGGSVTVEPWLLDFSGDLYGKDLTLEFHSFLRPEQKFASLEELQEEIRKNALQTRKFFEKN